MHTKTRKIGTPGKAPYHPHEMVHYRYSPLLGPLLTSLFPRRLRQRENEDGLQYHFNRWCVVAHRMLTTLLIYTPLPLTTSGPLQQIAG